MVERSTPPPDIRLRPKSNDEWDAWCAWAIPERLLEVEVRAAGLRRIELNVFGDNARAQRLYESLAYVEMARQMGKDLEPSDDD